MPAMSTLIVFDLDFTLWDAGGTWCDHLTPPFSRQQRRVVDRDGACIRLYPDVTRVLDWCCEQRLPVALASRTHEPASARRLLDLLDIRDRFEYEEIYPSAKDRHFKALKEQTGFAYDQMLFFDDEPRNIQEVAQLGVQAVPVDHGVTWDLFASAVGHSATRS